MNQQRQFEDLEARNFGQSGSGMHNTEEEYFLSGLPNRHAFRLTLEPETVLLNGHFVTKELLHRGRYCDVYRAFDNDRGHVVALKTATISPPGDKELENLIRNELTLNSRIMDYSHVLRIHVIHTCSHDGADLLLLSMEYANGGSLRQWLKNNAHNLELRRSEGLIIFRQICMGLAALHDQHILHLDLTPNNILFVDGMAKIADLGVSRLMFGAIQDDQQQETNIWPEIGTAAYMSPEQFLAPHLFDIDLRSDIYSLAVILFEICHPDCRTPFSGTFEFLRFRHLQITAPDIPDLDENTRRVIARGLKKNPSERYKAVSDLQLDLKGRLEQEMDQERDQSVQDMWIEVLERLEEQDFNGASALCSKILDVEPEHEKAAIALAELNERFQKAHLFYDTIRAGICNQSLDHLNMLMEEVICIYPNHPDGHLVQIQLLSLSHEYMEAMESAVESASRDKWSGVEASLQQAWRLSPGSTAVQKSLEIAARQREFNQHFSQQQFEDIPF